MIDNSKEYILCAAYKQKKNTVNRQRYIDESGEDIANIYYEPHKEVFDMRLGWRHPDILYQYRDEIDRSDSGGFCTSKGRYVSREEAYKIAVECGQITKGKYSETRLYSEDLY